LNGRQEVIMQGYRALIGIVVMGSATGGQTVFPAPTSDNIESGSEMNYGGDGYTVYVRNESSVPINVTGLQLYDCENIKSECGPGMPLKIRVDPGRQQNIFIVRIENTTRASHFRFHYSWEQAAAR
jgi:hypothetical protein